MAKKVLLYDDEADILEICKYILERKGYQVFAKETCANVIGDLKKILPDVVIMDNWIPDIGGVEATRLIKNDKDFKDTPVILFTANKDINRLVHEAGADAFIGKPFDLKVIEETVETLLTKKEGDSG